MGVENEVDSEQQNSKRADDHLEYVVVEDEAEDAQDEEGHAEDPDDAPFGREVSLGRASVCSAGCRDHCGTRGSTNNGLAVVEIVGALSSINVAHFLEGVDHADVRDKVSLTHSESQ